jgi:hypothetical protein
MEPLSREFLLNRGHCCNNGCKNCPYKEKKNMKERIKEMKAKMFTKDAITGWVIVAMFFVFVGLSIEPASKDPMEFFRVMGMVLGGGVFSGFVIMYIFERWLPIDEKKNEKK